MSIKSRKHPVARAANQADSRTLGLVLAALPGIALAGQAMAQEQRLGTVSVTEEVEADGPSSPKFTQPLQDTPQTIQIISRELLTQQGATTLTDALRNSPAVGTFHAGENGNTNTGDAIQMRGFDTSNSIFLDGVRDLGAVSRDLFNTESVEVTKGPAGTDNGRTAPSGAINMVSKQPFLEDAVSASVSAGVDGQKRITADWNQTLTGLPGSALRLNALWQDSDVAGREHVNNKRWGFAPSLAIGLDGATRAYLNLMYVDQDNVPDGFLPTVGLPTWSPPSASVPAALIGNPVDHDNFYGTRNDHDDVQARMATLKVEHDFAAGLTLTNTLRWGSTEQDYLLTSFMGTSIQATNPADFSTYTILRTGNTRDQQNDILTDQLNLRADFATGGVEHNLSTGLELTREKQQTYGLRATGARARASLYNPDWNDAETYSLARNGAGTKGRTDTFSVYVFDTLHFSEQFLVTAGLRADRYDTDYLSTGVCNNGTGNGAVPCGGAAVGSIVTTADLGAKDTLFNWKLGAVYKPVEAVSLYANYALSQQPPGGANFQLSTAANNANNPNLDPQEAETVEFGAKWSLFGEALALNLALFQTNVTNEINTQELDQNNNPTQTGKKRVRGVEVSALGNITEAWSVSAGYSYQDPKVVRGNSATQDGAAELPYQPEDGFTLWSTYTLPMGVTVGGGARYTGGLHRQNDGAVGTPKLTGGYTTFDAVASWNVNETLALRFNAYNIGDKEGIAAIVKSAHRYQPIAARTFLFSADLRF